MAAAQAWRESAGMPRVQITALEGEKEMTCRKDNHNYVPVSGSSYFKRTGDMTTLGLPKMNQSISYKIVVCSKCGESKEVIAADYREAELDL